MLYRVLSKYLAKDVFREFANSIITKFAQLENGNLLSKSEFIDKPILDLGRKAAGKEGSKTGGSG